MTALQPFDFTGRQVRVVPDAHGEPWFLGADVCAVLEIGNSSMAIGRLADDERSTLSSAEGGPARLLVSEAGLYRLIFTSRKAEAETFRRWVTHEVLPTIRRTGTYAAPATAVQLPTARELAALVLAEADRADAAERRAAELAPAAAAATALVSAAGDYSLRDAAHVLSRDHGIDTGQNRLLAHLRDIGWVDRRGLPYQEQIGNGRLSVRTRTYDHPHTGEPMLSNQLRVTAKGLTWLHAHWPTTTATVTKLAVAR